MRCLLIAACFACSPLAWAQPYGYFGGPYSSAVQRFTPSTLGQKSAMTFPGPVQFIAITPDGKDVFLEDSCCADLNEGSAWGVMDIPVGQVEGLFINLPVVAEEGPLAIAPNSKTLYVSSAYNANITVFDRASGEVTATIANPGGNLYQTVALLLSPDGSTIYQATQYIQTCSECDDTATAYITVIDVKTGAILRNIPIAAASVLAIAPDGKTAYAGTFQSISVVDLLSGEVTGTIAVGAYALALSPDGLHLYAGSDQFYVISTVSSAVTATVPLAGAERVLALALSGDAKTVYAAYVASNGYGGGLAQIALPEATIVQTISLAGAPGAMVVSPADGTVLTGLTSPSSTGVVDTTTNALARNIPFSGAPAPVVSHSGARLYMQNPEGEVTILDAFDLHPVGSVRVPSAITGNASALAITPDDQNLIEYGFTSSNTWALVEVNLATLVATTLVESRVEAVAVSRDSHYVYVACAGCAPGNVNLFGIIKYDLVAHTVAGFNPTAALTELFLSPDGSRLYFGVNSVAENGSLYIEVLDTATMKKSALMTQYGVTSSIALSDDGSSLWANAFDPDSLNPELYQFDAASLQLVDQIALPPGSDGSISVTPDGSKVYFSASSQTGIYGVTTGALTYTADYQLWSGLRFRTP